MTSGNWARQVADAVSSIHAADRTVSVASTRLTKLSIAVVTVQREGVSASFTLTPPLPCLEPAARTRALREVAQYQARKALQRAEQQTKPKPIPT